MCIHLYNLNNFALSIHAFLLIFFPFIDMEGEDLAITVLTCEGNIEDPTFPFKLQRLVAKLQNLISDGKNIYISQQHIFY